MQNIQWDEIGLKPTDIDPEIMTAIGMFIILDRAARKPFRVSSRFARDGAVLIAIAACSGLITTEYGDYQWGNMWMATEMGLEMRESLDDILTEIFDG